MKILLSGFGSRGDVQPLLALAQGLIRSGYDVTIAAGSNFRTWIESAGIGFTDMQVDVEAMMETQSAQSWVEGSSNNPLHELRAMRKLMNEYAIPRSQRLVDICAEADVLVSSLLTVGIFDSVAASMGKRHIMLMLQPMQTTAQADSTLIPYLPRRYHPLNRLSGFMQLAFMWNIFRDATNHTRQHVLKLPPLTRPQFRKIWNQTPRINGFSPLVAPHPPDWPAHVYTTGYWFYDQQANWQPSDSLRAFLEAGSPPVYLGFGSMSNSSPEATTRLMIEALTRTGQRGIIAKGWGRLAASDVPDSVFMLDQAPHDWLFPRMAAVIHHGGAGTTAAALRAGVPSTIVPHMADQPYWGRRVYELGVGSKMIPRHKLNAERLATAIRQMVTDQTMQHRAAELGQKIQQEDGVGRAVEAFNAILGQAQPGALDKTPAMA